MQLQIQFRDMTPSPAIEDLVREQADKLHARCARIISCRVVVEEPCHKHQTGNVFHVRIDAIMPGAELVADGTNGATGTGQDCHTAVRQAFAHIRRELDNLQGKRRALRTSASQPNAMPGAGF